MSVYMRTGNTESLIRKIINLYNAKCDGKSVALTSLKAIEKNRKLELIDFTQVKWEEFAGLGIKKSSAHFHVLQINCEKS